MRQNGKAKLVGYCTKDSLYDGAFNYSVGWKAAGMGYIIKTKTGKLIAVDGGNTVDARDFYALLQEYSDGGKIIVDHWILTHPHEDHVCSLIEMCKNEEIFENLTVKNLVYYFPYEFKDRNGCTCHDYISEMRNAVFKLKAKAVEPYNGQVITVDDTEIRFLYVPTDYAQLNNTNHLSLIFTITSEKKLMITGDAYKYSLEKLAEQYKTELKCDILQMPHHFLCDTGYLPFYKYADAQTVLLPTCIAGYKAMNNDPVYSKSENHLVNQFAAENADNVYKAFNGNFEIEL